MIRLVYMSYAVKPFASHELLGLLKSCRRNNTELEVSGVLLYSHDCFVQVLEGKEEIVNQLFQTIQKDPRHRDVAVLERTPIKKRQFADWSMGFEELSDQQLQTLNIPGLNHFFDAPQEGDQSAFNQRLLGSLMNHFRQAYKKRHSHEELPIDDEQHATLVLFHKAIRLAVTALAALMVLVIFLGVIDVLYVLYQQLVSPPYLMLTTSEMLATFGAFLAVLIAIEIFINISLYLRSDVIPIKLVVATALMAIARKVIVFDFKHLESDYVYASAAVVLALGITYWLLDKKEAGKTD